jgi:hypothetical protein
MDSTSFSGKPSMGFFISHSGGESGLRNRGIGGAGLSLEGGKPYTVSLYLWTGNAPTAFVELYDYTTNTSLARQDFSVQSAGPDWGSLWVAYNFTLTPSASTACVGIPFGSDPAIDCGGEAGPAHVCVRCGGEFRVGITSPSDFKAGYIELLPGAWGLVQSKRGTSIPVLRSVHLCILALCKVGHPPSLQRWHVLPVGAAALQASSKAVLQLCLAPEGCSVRGPGRQFWVPGGGALHQFHRVRLAAEVRSVRHCKRPPPQLLPLPHLVKLEL